ncbi:MAG TPA: hypothetical protein V6C65_40975 [Allocoleopsis sp.]
MEQFTASEVRGLASKYEDQWIPVELTGPAPSEAKRLVNMLHAFADLLEAQEKAVPVAWLEIPPGEQADPYYPGYKFHGLTSLPSGRHDLFLRPMTSAADAERLAEPVGYVDADKLKVFENGNMLNIRMWWSSDDFVGPIAELYTHPVPAQPPAASVTDAMVRRATSAWHRWCNDDTNPTAGTEDGMREVLTEALAAQENPNG